MNFVLPYAGSFSLAASPGGIRAVWWDYDFSHLLKKKRLGGGFTIIHYLAVVTDDHSGQEVHLHEHSAVALSQ